MSARRTSSVAVLTLALAGAGVAVAAPAHASTTWYVGGSGCSDSGSGTTTRPFCTIKKGVAAALAGDTVHVRPGTYHESVSMPRSGTSTMPITVEGEPGAVISGSSSLSDPARWAAESGGGYSTPLASNPGVVLVDGARVRKAASAPVAAGTWAWAEGVLHLNLGGGNPGSRSTEAGTLAAGVTVSGKSFITIRGLQVQRQSSYGISVTTQASHVLVSGCTVRQTGSYGVRVTDGLAGVAFVGNDVSEAGSNGLLVKATDGVVVRSNRAHANDNHGISLQTSHGSLVELNEAWANARPSTRAAVGIDLSAQSTGNTVQRNTTHDNQDSGIQSYSGSNDNLVRRNLSYRNGDHGFDTVGSTGVTYVGNTAYGNTKDGISIEGASTGTRSYDNVLVDNHEYDLWVDPGSWSGLVADDDVIWNSFGGTPVKANGTAYPSLAGLQAATQLETRGLGADPRFVSPATNAFGLAASSPALDSGNAGAPGFLSTDLAGQQPCDAAAVANTGLGTPTYTDRGALERSC